MASEKETADALDNCSRRILEDIRRLSPHQQQRRERWGLQWPIKYAMVLVERWQWGREQSVPESLTTEGYSGQAATKAAAEAVTTLSFSVELAAIQKTHFVCLYSLATLLSIQNKKTDWPKEFPCWWKVPCVWGRIFYMSAWWEGSVVRGWHSSENSSFQVLEVYALNDQ